MVGGGSYSICLNKESLFGALSHEVTQVILEKHETSFKLIRQNDAWMNGLIVHRK